MPPTERPLQLKLGIIALEIRLSATTRMPKRQDLHLVATDAIVEPVMNSSEKDALYVPGFAFSAGAPMPGSVESSENASASSSSTAPGAYGRFCCHHEAA